MVRLSHHFFFISSSFAFPLGYSSLCFILSGDYREVMEFPATNPAARPDQLPGAFLRELVDMLYVKLLCLGCE